jgi:hypothetical protein
MNPFKSLLLLILAPGPHRFLPSRTKPLGKKPLETMFPEERGN